MTSQANMNKMCIWIVILEVLLKTVRPIGKDTFVLMFFFVKCQFQEERVVLEQKVTSVTPIKITIDLLGTLFSPIRLSF